MDIGAKSRIFFNETVEENSMRMLQRRFRDPRASIKAIKKFKSVLVDS
jgi:hypothetical protein